MRKEFSIDTAPKDGTKIIISWIDEDGQRSESLAQYRALDRMKKTGGDWDESDAGWWVFINSKTQKKVIPDVWIRQDDEDDLDPS